MTAMRKVKLGIIGTGLAARNLHLPALMNLKSKFKIIAVCNHTEKKAKDFAKLVGDVPYYLDYKELLERDDIEAVLITLPIELNYKVCRDAMAAGKHVLLEKPLSANLREAKQLLALEKKYKTVKMVGENYRYRNIFLKAKKYIDEGKIGKVYSFNWNVFQRVDTTKDYGATLWRQQHQYPGGFLLDGGVHYVAAIRYLLGDFKFISPLTDSVDSRVGKLDTLMLQFISEKGIPGILNLFFSVQAHSEDRLLIFGDKGTIEILSSVLLLKKEGKKDKVENLEDQLGFENELNEFYKAVVKGQKVISSFKEAYGDMEVIINAVKAAKNKRKVNL